MTKTVQIWSVFARICPILVHNSILKSVRQCLMDLVNIKVQSLMPKVQGQSQKSEALFKLVWTTVQLSKRHDSAIYWGECQTCWTLHDIILCIVNLSWPEQLFLVSWSIFGLDCPNLPFWNCQSVYFGYINTKTLVISMKNTA